MNQNPSPAPKAPVSSAAAAAVANTSPRRSGRERVSTTMQIRGHTVLRKNNYKVNGITYIFDANDEDAPKPARKKPKTTSSSSEHRIRQVTPAQAHRKKHNQFVDDAIARKSKLRMSFLAERLDLLRPFLDKKVVNQLQAFRNQNISSSGNSLSGAAPSSSSSVTQPKMIQTAILRPYQLEGLEFMAKMHEQNLAMILGDEMGLGKTLQTISLLCHLKEQEDLTGPSLIICPLSVLSSWCNEMERWAPSLKYIMVHASDREEQARQRKHISENATKYDVILTTYEMAKAPTLASLYQRQRFHYLVLDEGHKIKGYETQISMAVRKIHAGNKLLLTGTPLQNNLVELWSLLNFLYPEIFTIRDPFETHYNLSENIVDKSFLSKTQKLLELFMLRRLKQEVEKLIPKKLETKVYCPLSKVQTFWYKALLMKDLSRLARVENTTDNGQSKGDINKLRSLFMQLRKCSNHPFFFDGAETNPDETSVEDLIGASGKLSVLDMLLRSLFKKGHRAVFFTQFTMLLDLVEDYCILRGWKYCRLDGSTERARRNYHLRRFNEPNSEYFLFLMSTRSGGMGLNLQTADTCILFDSDWNPQQDIQAMARVHRIGQKKTVHVYRLVTTGTVEERLLERAEKKLLLEMVNRDAKKNTSMDPDPDAGARGLSAGELWDDIKFGCEAVFGNSSNNELPSEEEIAAITNRARKESDSVGKLTGGTSLTSKTFDGTKEFSNSQLFRGVDFQQLRKQQQEKEKSEIPNNLKGIAHLWHEIKSLENKKRERKSRICQIEGKGSGYGSKYVPVLAANNYTFGGESSVFERELKQSNKSNFEVKKREEQPPFEHTSECVICGNGGHLVCCKSCPNTAHLCCTDLANDSLPYACPHHRCSLCDKSRANAGGVLYPCAACPNSYCEACLPKEGVTFVDKVERFEKLGFDSTKHNVYIHCSPRCENYAVHEYGYVPGGQNSHRKLACPEAIDLSGYFGASYDLNEAAAAVNADKESITGRGKRNVARKNYRVTPEKKMNGASPCTPATEVASDTSSFCVGDDSIGSTPASSGRDTGHAIEID